MIKKICFSLLFLLLISCSSENKSYDVEKFKALGGEKFSSPNWMSSNQEKRAMMVYDLLKNGNFIGKTRKDVIALLGEPTSYFDYDEYPAYVVGPKSVTSEYAKGYVLAFITEESSGLIKGYEFVPKL